MSLEETTQQLWQAAEKKRVCRVRLKGEPLTRTIHPYGVCRTSANQIVLVCWQAMGFTKAGGKAGFRNLLLSKLEEVEVLAMHFQKSNDFNPVDGQYQEWVFHI